MCIAASVRTGEAGMVDSWERYLLANQSQEIALSVHVRARFVLAVSRWGGRPTGQPEGGFRALLDVARGPVP